jgi:hypothetical protein
MALLLVDLDLVLVMNASGQECRRGDEIYRTSPTPAFDAAADLGVVVVTHRTRRAARQLLAVAGLPHVDGTVTASDMLTESLRELVRGRYHGLGKVTVARLLRTRYRWRDAGSTVLVDDKPFNLIALIKAGVARWGVRVPEVRVNDGRAASFDCAALLAFAAGLARGAAPALPEGARWLRVESDGRLVPVDAPGDGLGFIAEAARSDAAWPLPNLSTGHRFAGDGIGLVSALRLVKAAIRGRLPRR